MSAPTRSIGRLLVANRGEIARRIMRTAHEMGLGTVAVYADGDVGEPFVAEADVALALGGRSALETYLDIAKLIRAAERSGADAIHPGYGFLAENAAFAQAVLDAGLVWVGPPPAAIAAMGDKLEAKRLAVAAGVATLPMATDPGEADTVGFPLLVKAAAGGGGKGMRVVTDPAGLEEAVAAARREAEAAFGDGTVFLERYVARARHIEVQVLGDLTGHLVHFGERECSVQRRHQKVFEEAPSPALDPDTRVRLGEAAVAAAHAVGYHNAGTVEFLYDDESNLFYFLEMNTRLQVEHPVTEAVTGIDLVREQLRVAQGEPLGYDQADISFDGHAVEARLYAEDPAQGFLPASGSVVVWEPASSPAVRFDSGIEESSIVGVEFDPLLAKVIAHAPSRREASLRLALALERTWLAGLTTNREFLINTLRHPAFLAGDTTTDFIERHAPAARHEVSDDEQRAAAVAVALWRQGLNRRSATVLRTLPAVWRNSHLPPERFELAAGTVEYQPRRDGAVAVTWRDRPGTARIISSDDSSVELELDGERIHARITALDGRYVVHLPAVAVELEVGHRFPGVDESGPVGGLVAPMPGKVTSVRAAPGDAVTAGQVLAVMEAMKMEHHLSTPADGVVADVRVAVGDQVATGDVLLVVDEA